MINPAQPDYTNTPVSSRRPRFAYSPTDLTTTPAVTIITPFYNTGAIFEETAQSVLQQSIQQWEWLIVNDGSTDPEALAIIDSYRQRDPRIRVIDHAENTGPSAARNTGFRAARAPYVVQLDSDDLLEPTAAEKWAWFLESHPEFAFVKGYSVGFSAQEYLWEKGFHNGSAFLENNLVHPISMVRKAVHEAIGGYDGAIRAGLEDWDFWLRCASHNYWGGTIPEYLDWYRRRSDHGERWTNWDNAERQRAFHARLRQQYGSLWNGGFPQIQLRQQLPYDAVSDTVPFANSLKKDKRRLLLIVPWLTFGGADKFNLDLVQQLHQREWEMTIAATLKSDHAWFSAFASHTPDIFILPHFLRLVDYPRFLRYLIRSRQIDVVLISHSELGYLLLPYLRAHCPEVAFVDLCHLEEEYWKNGGYPRFAVDYQELLDLNIVVSEHLKQWMVRQGGDSQRIPVCHINVDADKWRPAPERRVVVRQELGVDETLPVILYVGRICDQKQPRVFAHTMLQLARKKVSFSALVAGDGPDLEWLRSFVKRHKLDDQVRLLGSVANEQVRECMAAADVFFLPSQWEGIALSIYEAMACGLPVVGADVGGQRELVTADCGILLTRSDEETESRQYAEILAELLYNPQRRQQLGQAGRARIQTHFRLEHMGERMSALLREAMQLSKTAPRPTPSLGLGRTCAAQGIEYVRLSEVADGLWRERGRTADGPLSFQPHLLDPHSDSWGTLAYFTLRRLFLPYYRTALEKNFGWLVPLKDGLKRALLRTPAS